ncbi:hypothetical protein M0802_000498 [Mischocyttarus mexicanus]|nr:hypothetical protein M0802_000498 [Mischocyttarus mexicanus]
MAKVYTMNEVGQHNKETDLWLAMHGGVYDLTSFLKKHPGGEEVFIQSAGKDCTKCFDDIGHSEEAQLLKETFKIGVVGKSDEFATDLITSKSSQEFTISPSTEEANAIFTTDDDDSQYTEPKEKINETLPIAVVALACAVFAYAISYLYF